MKLTQRQKELRAYKQGAINILQELDKLMKNEEGGEPAYVSSGYIRKWMIDILKKIKGIKN